MLIYSLDGKWTLQYDGESLPVQVPGSLYHDLLQNEKIDDPYWRDNEDKTRHLVDKGAVYSRVFTVTDEMLLADALILHCDGLDTLADIYINGQCIGAADNMHRIWEFPLCNLKPGENTISVEFKSPIEYIRRRNAEIPADGTPDAMVGFPHLRKAHCMFGWDWGPRLPDLGIWRSISIYAVTGARLKSVQVSQQHETGRVTLSFIPEIDHIKGNDADYTVEYELTAPDGTVFNGNPIVIDNPQLWWANGLGEQPLYTLEAKLCNPGSAGIANVEIDVWKKRIGLRILTVSREKDEHGEEFAYIINGHKLFAMGADYIPEDNIFPRMNPERTRVLLEDCVLANMNSVRIWGGGFYPDGYFYDICDELGLIVWQDFMFCCAVYELDEAFEANIVAEIEDNVRRLRHHASLGLWCGNNEMEWHIKLGLWKTTPAQYSAYFYMYEHLFPKICKALNPETFYWPASPSSGGGFDEPNDPNRGDVHYWSVWHGIKPFSDYRNYHFRFASEFGFQSFPEMKTIESFTLPEDRNVFSYIMEKHQRSGSANGKIVYYLSQTYLYPTSFEGLVYASQLLQADAIKYGVEHWRRNRGRCMGAIYWQLNDCWPVASWASVDYFGRWKALHYAAKRFFAPILLSAEETGVMDQQPNVNAENFDIKKSAKLNVSNETLAPFSGTVNWALRRPDASIIKSGSAAIEALPLSAVWLDTLDFADACLYENYLSYELRDASDRIVSSETVLFCLPKHFKFEDPKLTVHAEGDEIIVRAQAYAKYVEVYSSDSDFILSDNFFDLNAGVCTVKILRGNAKNLQVRSVYDIR